MKLRTVSLLWIVILLLIIGLSFMTLVVHSKPLAQGNETEQNQTLDALVNQRFTQTAQVQQQNAVTETVNAAFNLALTETASVQNQQETATTAFENTLDAKFSQALSATAQLKTATAASYLTQKASTSIPLTKTALQILPTQVMATAQSAILHLNKITVENARTLALITVLNSQQGAIWSLAFSPDGNILASGGEDKTIRLWDVRTLQQIAILSGHEGTVFIVAFSPDGKTLASGSEDKTVRLWDISTKTLRATLTGHTGQVTSISFSPDGKLLASAAGGWTEHDFGQAVDNRNVSDELDPFIRIWDVAGAKPVKTINASVTPRSVAFNTDGTEILSQGFDPNHKGPNSTVFKWNINTGNVGMIYEDDTYLNSLGFIATNDEHILNYRYSGGGNSVYWWPVDDPSLGLFVGGTTTQAEGIGNSFLCTDCFSLSPDGNLFLSGESEFASLYHVNYSTRWGKLINIPGEALSAKINPENDLIAVAGHDGNIRLWGNIATSYLPETSLQAETLTPLPNCSAQNGVPSRITIENDTKDTLNVYWVNDSCEEFLSDTIDPGFTVVSHTDAAQMWRIREKFTGKLVEEIAVTDPNEQVTIH